MGQAALGGSGSSFVAGISAEGWWPSLACAVIASTGNVDLVLSEGVRLDDLQGSPSVLSVCNLGDLDGTIALAQQQAAICLLTRRG